MDHPRQDEVTVSGYQVDDVTLLQRSVTDAEAFGVFYRRHAQAVLRYCYQRTGCAETSADLTAEVFAAAFVQRSSFRDEGRPARNWLYGIARRQIGAYARARRVSLRYRKRLGMDVVVLDADEVERLEARLDAGAFRLALTDALSELSISQREALRLRVLDGLPYAEVARRLGCSEGAARVRVCRALTRLGSQIDMSGLEGV